MAKKASKKAGGAAAERRNRTARTTTGGTVRRPAATSKGDTSVAPRAGRGASSTGDPNARPGEPELSRLRREEEAALGQGDIQPHPQNAARQGKTSVQAPPLGRAHINPRAESLRTGEGTRRVEATMLGYYNHVRRREGDVFTLIPIPNAVVEEPILDKDGEPKEDRHGRVLTKRVTRTLTAEEQFSPNWMRYVDEDTPEKVTTGAEALRAHHDELLADRVVSRGTGSADVI